MAIQQPEIVAARTIAGAIIIAAAMIAAAITTLSTRPQHYGDLWIFLGVGAIVGLPMIIYAAGMTRSRDRKLERSGENEE